MWINDKDLQLTMMRDELRPTPWDMGNSTYPIAPCCLALVGHG